MQRLAGKDIFPQVQAKLAEEVARLSESGISVTLAVILVGEDPASQIYVASKERTCGELGIGSLVTRLPSETTQAELLELVQQYNENPQINGILVQVPLPAPLDEDEVLQAISPDKDVDCFHPYNLGLLTAGLARFVPCTPFGVLQFLKHHQIPTSGKKIVILGRSNIFGRPMSILLSQKPWDATVTLCHSRTQNLAEECRQADILIAAIGKPMLVTKDFIKPGAVVIDVGINRIADPNHPKGSRVVGDVDYEGIASVASAATPVPGGVGISTIAMLMYNVVNAARFANGLEAFEL